MSDQSDMRTWSRTFGRDAERYDRTRPGYPPELLDRIIAASPGRRVLDVGCGTGIVTRALAATGCDVLGLDPDPGMVELATRTGVDAEIGAFETWDPAGRTFDAVVAGQAWHWIDATIGPERAAAVLEPAGRLAAFWNVFQPPPDVAAGFAAVYARVVEGPLSRMFSRPSLEGYSTQFARAAEGIEASGRFGPVEDWRYEAVRTCERDAFLDGVPSFGGHGQLPPEALTALLEGLGAVVDAAGGTFEMTYTTVAVTAALDS